MDGVALDHQVPLIALHLALVLSEQERDQPQEAHDPHEPEPGGRTLGRVPQE